MSPLILLTPHREPFAFVASASSRRRRSGLPEAARDARSWPDDCPPRRLFPLKTVEKPQMLDLMLPVKISSTFHFSLFEL